MPEQGFLEPIFLSINRFQGRTALGVIEMKLIGELIDNVLARTKFFDDSTVFQKQLAGVRVQLLFELASLTAEAFAFRS